MKLEDVRPVPRVSMIQLAEDGPLADEWPLAVIGPHFAGLLTARPRNLPGHGDESLLLALSYHQPTVLRAAQAMLLRITAG